MSINELYEIFLRHRAVETDTRKIKEGDIFFALKGPNFNGNKYAKAALEKGASYCICDEISDAKSDRIIFVDDVLDTLQQLAGKHREQFNIPFIGITGSNGKTTTKELVHAVLSSKYKCYTTQGNLNNHIGVPLTILSIKQDAEIAVIEMGANHLLEIAGYCRYAMPTHGLITNIGKAHLEGFGSVENIKKAKGELFDFIRAHDGTAFIYSDYEYLKEVASGIRNIITYGTEHADFTGKVKSDSAYLEVEITDGAGIGTIMTQLAGNYNLPNVLSAVCIGKTFGVEEEKIKSALENYAPGNSRSQIIKSGTNTIVLDAYNANPSSMKAAIENFANMAGGKKAVILGGMMELGADSIQEHRDIIDLLQRHSWDKIAVAGKDYKDLPGNIAHFNSSEEAAAWFREQQFEDTLILIKGSRGTAMEKVLA